MPQTFNELRARYDDGTPAERQRVLDRLPITIGPIVPALWELALRAEYEPEVMRAAETRYVAAMQQELRLD